MYLSIGTIFVKVTLMYNVFQIIFLIVLIPHKKGSALHKLHNTAHSRLRMRKTALRLSSDIKVVCKEREQCRLDCFYGITLLINLRQVRILKNDRFMTQSYADKVIVFKCPWVNVSDISKYFFARGFLLKIISKRKVLK